MNKRQPKTRVKNPCRICNQTVALKSGVQCKGACARWAHYKCLGYSHKKILEIRDGLLTITCPCPHCTPKVPVEVVKQGKTIGEFIQDLMRKGDDPTPTDAPEQSPKVVSARQSPGNLQVPGPQHFSIDATNPPSCARPRADDESPYPPMACDVTKVLKPSCPVDRTTLGGLTIHPRDLPPRKQYLYKPYIRKQAACQPLHGKAPCLEPGKAVPPCQPTEEISMFEAASPKRSCIKPKDDFAFQPTSFEPQLFQPKLFKYEPRSGQSSSNLQARLPCDAPRCREHPIKSLSPTAVSKPAKSPTLVPEPIPPSDIPADLPPEQPPDLPPAPLAESPAESPPITPSDSPPVKPTASPPDTPDSLPETPLVLPPAPPEAPRPDAPTETPTDSPLVPGTPLAAPPMQEQTPPLSRTPSKISLVSPIGSPKQSTQKCPIACKIPPIIQNPPRLSAKTRLTRKDQKVSPMSIHISMTTKDQHNSPISSKIKWNTKDEPNSPVSNISRMECPKSSTPASPIKPCDDSAPCKKPPPDTSLSCCQKCNNCNCSSSLSMMKSNCALTDCPKNVLAKTPPKAPSPSLKSAPCAEKTMKLCMDCTSSICPQQFTSPSPTTDNICSQKEPCVDCTSSTCPNHIDSPNLTSMEMCAVKKSKSCACLTALKEPLMRSVVSDSRLPQPYHSLLFSAIDQLCVTMGQLSGQIKMLMSKMRINS